MAPPSSQDEPLGRYSVSREVPRSILKYKTVLGTLDATPIFVFSSDHGGSEKGHGELKMLHLETPFILYGKNIRKGYVLDEPTMQYDLSATLAYALGLKVPQAWRGRPLTSMFD